MTTESSELAPWRPENPKPPNAFPVHPLDCIAHFLNLANEYRQLCDAFPVDQKTYKLGGRPNPETLWRRYVRAFALRKFFLGEPENEAANIKWVMAAIAHYDPDISDDLDCLKDLDINRFSGGIVSVYGNQTLNNEDAKKLIEDAIYGGFLHGNYERWARQTTARLHRTRLPLQVDQSLRATTQFSRHRRPSSARQRKGDRKSAAIPRG